MGSLTIANLLGVDIRLHPSFALVLAWVLVDWRDFGWTTSPAQMAVAALMIVLLYGCVLLHEMGHALVAREHGIRVQDVTLSAIGGVARMESLPLRPRTEVAIALAGPGMNVAIAAALLPLVLVVGVALGFNGLDDYVLRAFDPSLGGLLFGLFFANLLLMLFNLLPAFPMDGGHVLRAGLVPVFGRERATQVAVRVAQGLAAVIAVAAIVGFRNPWLVLLALLLAGLAQAEGRAARIESAMRRMRVGQFALWDMGGVSPDQPIAYALRGGPRDVAVTRNGEVVGMLWRNTLLNELARSGHHRTVGEVASETAMLADVNESVYDVHQRMVANKAWAVPVIEDGVYRGIFTADRFLHVYRQLAPNPLEVAASSGPLEALRGVVRSLAN